MKLNKNSALFLVSLCLLFSALIFYTQSECDKKSCVTDRSEVYTKPISLSKGISFIDSENGELVIYNFDLGETHVFDKKVMYNSGAIKYGENTPINSPDLFYTAAITDSNELILISNSTYEFTVVNGTKGTTYLVGWTSDSMKIIYYVSGDNISTRDNLEVTKTGIEKFDTNRSPPGFYSFDINTAESSYLYPLSNAIAIVGTNKVLTEKADSNFLTLFNIDSFEVDYEAVPGIFGFNYSQFDISSNGSMWAFLKSNTTSEFTDSQIIVAEFPKQNGSVIARGPFSEIQWPIFSPGQNSLIYHKVNGIYSPGIPKCDVHLYNFETRKSDKLTSGRVLRWVDNDNLIIERRVKPFITNKTTLLKFNVKTLEHEVIF